MKKCQRCHVLKKDVEFVNEKGKIVKTCKRCREVMKVWFVQNRDESIERARGWRAQNRERIRERNKVYCDQNKGELSKRKKVYYRSPARYSTFSNRLTILEAPIEGKEGELFVKCAKCGIYFTPTNQAVQNRISALNSEGGWESRLYCSDECKYSCEVFHKKSDPFERATQLERDPTWSKNVKERANYTCERCGSKERLEAHHEVAVKIDSTKANDLDNGICLCHDCHMKAHSESGCTLSDLRKHNATNPQS